MQPLKFYFSATNLALDWKLRLILAICGLLFISVAVTFFSLDIHHGRYYTLIYGSLLLIFAVGYTKLIRRCYIALDDQGIRAAQYTIQQMMKTFPYILYFKSPTKTDVAWNEIEAISIRPLKITIHLKDGAVRELELGALMYKQHQLFKERLDRYISEKGIANKSMK